MEPCCIVKHPHALRQAEFSSGDVDDGNAVEDLQDEPLEEEEDNMPQV